jgi:radical SAM protein with 4Fe4S-binding SPASM domain
LGDFEKYINDCFTFASKASQAGIFCIFRLWNNGGLDSRNEEILAMMRKFFPDEWVETPKGYRVANRIFIEWDRKFDWPDLEAPCYDGDSFCLGIREQIGILSDGTVVPCCLDSDGVIALGNIFTSSIEDILGRERAKNILHGFQKHSAVEELCRKCSYRTKFNRS